MDIENMVQVGEETAIQDTIMTSATGTSATRNRLKSWAVWVAVLGLVGLLLQATGVFEKIGLDSQKWELIVTAVGTVLTAFGIVNNPTDKNHF